MQILQASVEAFKAAIEDNVVPHQFLDQVFTYFNYLYFDKIDTRTDKEFGEKLLYSIDTCRANSRELHFIMDSCPAQVLLQPLFSSNSNCSCSTLVINQSPFRCNGSRNLRQLSGTSFSMSFFSTTGSSMVPSMTLFLKLHSNWLTSRIITARASWIRVSFYRITSGIRWPSFYSHVLFRDGGRCKT